MKFVRIEMLFLVWTIPVLLLVYILGMRKRDRVLSRFSTPKGLSCISPDSGKSRRWIKACLMLSIVLFASIALTGPQYGYKWQEIERKGIDIIIALDCSRSMLADDIKPTRLDRAKREVFDLLGLLQGDRVGLVAFAGTAFLQCPLTLDYDAFNLFLNSLTPDFLPVGGTDLPTAINTASEAFNEGDNTEKAVVLITDGESTDGSPEEAAQLLAKAGIKLFCIGVGKSDGVPVPDMKGGFKKDASGNIVLTRLDEKTLNTLSTATGGCYVRSVAGDMDLDAIYTREIRGKMEASTVSGGRKQVWEDRYQWFLALALMAFIIELFLPETTKCTAIMLLCLMWIGSATHAEAGQLNQSLHDGINAYEQGDYETALNHFIDAQLNAPDRSELYYNIGNTYYRLNDFKSAEDQYQQALKSEKSGLRQKTFYNLGNAQYRNGKLKEALSSYEEALKLDPNDEQARANVQFVKTVIEQQKEQKAQSGTGDDDRQDKPGEGASGTSGRSSDQNGDQSGDQNKQMPELSNDPEKSAGSKPEKGDENGGETASYGSHMNDNRNDDPGPGAGPSSPDGKDENSGSRGSSAASTDADGDSNENRQAERMLNRLKDMPGKAMVPLYQKRHIEKDW